MILNTLDSASSNKKVKMESILKPRVDQQQQQHHLHQASSIIEEELSQLLNDHDDAVKVEEVWANTDNDLAGLGDLDLDHLIDSVNPGDLDEVIAVASTAAQDTCTTNTASTSSASVLNEPFNFLNDLELQGMANNEVLSADCMWSSSLNFLDSVKNQKGRNRDDSLTLSECADSLFKDIDLLSGHNNAIDIAHNTHQAPRVPGSDMSDSSTDEEEIDVVSEGDSDVGSVSSSTVSAVSSDDNSSCSSSSAASYFFSIKQKPVHRDQVQAGRSLLRNNRLNSVVKPKQQQQQQQQTVLKSKLENNAARFDHMSNDHCYFSTTPAPDLLTPNESSDDEEFHKKRSSPNNTAVNRQIVQAVNQLRRHRTVVDHQNVKFKFRMKFKSGKHGEQQQQQQQQQQQRPGTKRRSAMQNPHCPSPVKRQRDEMDDGDQQQLQQQSKRRKILTPYQEHYNDSGNCQQAMAEQKSREIRDLHNSMERQRRVDLRNNFDQLKDVVPDLKDVEKASKLNILNKSADFCRSLAVQDAALSRQRDRELQRNSQLRKKLANLVANYNNKTTTTTTNLAVTTIPSVHHQHRVTSSGRVSLVSSRHSAATCY